MSRRPRVAVATTAARGENGKNNSTQLMALQARFQQKQLQEKEQKLLQLYDQQQQRAHQVAQRGSAGSNGSNHSISANTTKVRHLFADERRQQQNGAKGIDKSYPLEPLKSNKKTSPISKTISGKPIATASVNNNNSDGNNMTNRKLNANVAGATTTTTTTTTTTRRVMKADANSNVSSRSSASAQRVESNLAASSRHRENFLSRESYGTSCGEAANGGESIRQVNGHGTTKNGYHYEINIDEVIDNEALQRNRMLAKFQPGDIERRRRQLSADINDDDDDEFPVDTQRDVSSRKSSLKNAKSNSTIAPAAATAVPTKKTIPRKSTLMKTTESASLKVCKPPANRNRLVMRRKSSLVRKPKKIAVEKPKKTIDVDEQQQQQQPERCCEISERCFPPPWNTLKSTSLICEIIRKHSKLQQMRSKSKMGRVKTIVTKIENQTIAIKPSVGATTPKFIPVAKSIEKRLLEMTRSVEPAPSTCQGPALDLLNANFVEALKAAESNETMVAKSIENDDHRVDANAKNNKPSDARETKAVELDDKDRQACPRRVSAEDVNRVRRASFEQKRMMFELLHRHRQRVSRHNSVESVLRHFDAIDEPENGKDEAYRSCRKGSASSDGARRIPRGFERSTSAWTIRTAKSARHARRKTSSSSSSSSKKILEARDSIELARVPVMTNLPACKKKIISHARKYDDAHQSYQRRRERSSSPEVAVSAKADCCVTSATRTEAKKPDPVAKLLLPEAVKSVTPYPSSKSPDNTEAKSRSVVKSTSLKLLNRFAGSNGDVNNTETDLPVVPRKSSSHTVEPLQNDEKLVPTTTATARASPITPAPRTSPSSSSVGTTRSQGSRPSAKTKTPTPAIRTTAPPSANADDSLVTCKICTRRFQSERIVKHEQICAKTAQKKRKQFDAVGHRVKGTELESFVQKPNKKQNKAAAAAAAAAATKVESQKSNWRRKHEDFINAIRSAKQMQAHLAAGGKLSDLPPPPPSDTSDYVQCPHCLRKFNQGAAERHIPKCESMQHNKPKPRPKR